MVSTIFMWGAWLILLLRIDNSLRVPRSGEVSSAHAQTEGTSTVRILCGPSTETLCWVLDNQRSHTDSFVSHLLLFAPANFNIAQYSYIISNYSDREDWETREFPVLLHLAPLHNRVFCYYANELSICPTIVREFPREWKAVGRWNDSTFHLCSIA